MGKRKSGKIRKSREKGISVDSEDEFRNEEEPDSNARKYTYDEIDEFHERNEQALLAAGKPYKVKYGSDNEEVYSLDLSDVDEDDDYVEEIEDKAIRRYTAMKQKDEMESDIESEEDEDDGNNWGTKSSNYYNSDFVSGSHQTYNQSQIEMNNDEETDGLRLLNEWGEYSSKDRKQLLFNDNNLKSQENKQIGSLNEIYDCAVRRKEEKEITKETPQLTNIFEDLKVKMIEIRDQYQPLMDMIRLGEIPQGPGSEYINCKFHLLLNYCTNVCFYIMLNAQRESLKYHPIVEALFSYRKLLKELEPMDEKFKDEIQRLLDHDHDRESYNSPVKTAKKKSVKKKLLTSELIEPEILMISRTKKVKPEKAAINVSKTSADDNIFKSNKKRKLEVMETEDEKEALKMYEYMKKGRKQETTAIELDEDKSSEEDNEEHDNIGDTLEETGEESGKRAITYQIEKNKGITPYRAKERRNPRVKYRNKYRKAQIRRKGQVSEVRKEISKYSGEHTGIKINSVRSTKLK